MHSSAVDDMSISEMRKLLAVVRSQLHTQTEFSPFNFAASLENGMTMYDFVYCVTSGIYEKKRKRVQKHYLEKLSEK